MFKLERQVLLTYITWRWMWFIIPLALFMILNSVYFATPPQNNGDILPFPFTFGVSMPILVCMHWFVAIAKWQFANPRARLIPGFKSPHLTIIASALMVLLILNPLLLAYSQGISPLGHIAYSLLLGGLFLQALQSNSSIAALPTLVVFFSGMYPTTSQFWFSAESRYVAIHSALVITGLGLVIARLWRLATLNEEMDDYQVMPLGTVGSLSRLEQVEQRRILGRQASRKGLWKRLADSWHDRLANHAAKPVVLSDYGWGKISPGLRAGLAGIGLTVYGLVLNRLLGSFDKPNALNINMMILIAALAIPAIASSILLRTRRTRMALELLRPARRSIYFDGLLKSLVKTTLLLWLAMTLGLWIAAASDPRYSPRMAAGYIAFSLSLQCPALAIGLRLALLRSQILFSLGCYALGLVEFGLLAYWVFATKFQGTLPFALVIAVASIALGYPLFQWARRCWLHVELG